MLIEDSSPPAVTKRRRSSLLKRISTGFSLIPIAEEVSQKQYVCEARQEKDEWRTLVVDRKQKSREVQKVLAETQENLPTLDYNSIEEDLSQDDKEMLSRFPDFSQISHDLKNVFTNFGALQAEVSKMNRARNTSFLSARENAISSDIVTYCEEAPLWLADPK